MLKHLDARNAKALFRRAFASKSFGRLEDAVRDLEAVLAQDSTKSDVKAELDTCLRLLAQKTSAATCDAEPAKIQEIGGSSVDTEEAKAEERPKKMKNLQPEVIEKAAEIA